MLKKRAKEKLLNKLPDEDKGYVILNYVERNVLICYGKVQMLIF